MDNDSYEQDFINSIKQDVRLDSESDSHTAKNRLTVLLAISIVFSIVIMIESIALVVFAVNYGKALGINDGIEVENTSNEVSANPKTLSENSSYNYNSEFKITAFNLKCTSNDGMEYKFAKNGTYQKTDSSSEIIDSGSYSIVDNGAVVLNQKDSSNQDKILYFDFHNIIEGVDFYPCDEI